MPVRKLKPIEERDPYAALVMEAWDKLEEGNMSTVKKPITPLPHHVHAATLVYSNRADEIIATFKRGRNADYYAHAANAYPQLVEALRVLTELCENVPIFQLDDGKASVKAVRLAGKFTGAMDVSRALLRELGESA